MTQEQFDDLVNRLEGEARCKPSAYRSKVFLLSSLGNAYIGVIILIVLGLLAALIVSIFFKGGWIAAKGIGIVGAFLYLVLRPLWVRIEPPAGIHISAGQAPELFAAINELRSKLGAPRLDQVLVTDEINAAILQLPRLGIFGWPRNYLMIGMPLMKSLTCEQFKAVLAHEFGHLAKGHGIVSHSIYRQRLRWSRLMAVLEASETKGRFLFMPFLNWFVPYFSAYSFPLARANEYEADAISVRLTSSRVTAEALTSIEVVGGYLTDLYWPRIDAEFGEQSQPSREPYFEMSDAFATRLDKVSGQIWLGPAMARQTTSDDTHPALRERLAAIGEEPSFSPPEPGQSADGLLGPSLEATIKLLDSKWKDNILPAWELRHEEIQEGRRRLAELNEKHTNGVDLTIQERRERAELTEAIRDADLALDQLRALHESVPDDAGICLALGSRLIMRNDETGCVLVKRALQSDEDAILQGCELLRDYYWRNGYEEEYDAWNRLLIEEAEIQRDGYKERNRVSSADEFEPHGLPEDTLAALVAQLRAIPGLSTVYFMRKRVLFLSHRPCYVLGYKVTGLIFLNGVRRATKVLERIQNSVEFPGDTFIINVDGPNYWLRAKFERMRWPTIWNHTPVLDTMKANIRLLGVLAVLGGICLLVVLIFAAELFSGLDWLLVFGTPLMLIAVGIKWLTDPIN